MLIMNKYADIESFPIISNGPWQAVGDGAVAFAASSELQAACNMQSDSMDVHYYSTTFSGGPGVCLCDFSLHDELRLTLRFLCGL